MKRGRISECADEFGCEYHDGKKPWGVECYAAFPSATQNEINGADAKLLVKNGCVAVTEGANMPSNSEAVDVFLQNKILYGPGKAANAGGVAVSGLEMAQNSQRLNWTSEHVDNELKIIMENIYTSANDASVRYGAPGNLVVGANVAGFLKVANAMLDQGNV